MIQRKSWEEFRESELLWFVNRSLHLFGWSIVCHIAEDGTISEAYPARVKFRGFDEKSETEGFAGLTEYLKETVDELVEECK